MTHLQTPSQTIGPFFHAALLGHAVDDLDPQAVAGDPIVVAGTVLDGAGDPVGDAMVEVWQSDGHGRYRHPADGRAEQVPAPFIGFGRVGTAADGTYRLRTVMPGAVPGPAGVPQAPHLNVHLFARGLLDLLSTRIYFEDAAGNDDDPVLASVPEHRRATLLARREPSEDGAVGYRFDIVLQGPSETVFFDI